MWSIREFYHRLVASRRNTRYVYEVELSSPPPNIPIIGRYYTDIVRCAAFLLDQTFVPRRKPGTDTPQDSGELLFEISSDLADTLYRWKREKGVPWDEVVEDFYHSLRRSFKQRHFGTETTD